MLTKPRPVIGQKLDEIEGRLSRIITLLSEKKGLSEKPMIFLGPSLSLEIARHHIDAEFRPPIARGDLPKAIQEGFRWIGIVDGVFHQSLTVSIQEIRAALECGAKIYGSSSMGALRAAEAYPLGMIGAGTIYQWYRKETIDSDDEVAVGFDPVTLKSLSLPLVNLRASLERLKSGSLIDVGTASRILEAAQHLPFPQRSHDNILLEYEKRFLAKDAESIRRLLLEHEVDLKGEDAMALLNRMKTDYESHHFPRAE